MPFLAQMLTLKFFRIIFESFFSIERLRDKVNCKLLFFRGKEQCNTAPWWNMEETCLFLKYVTKLNEKFQTIPKFIFHVKAVIHCKNCSCFHFLHILTTIAPKSNILHIYCIAGWGILKWPLTCTHQKMILSIELCGETSILLKKQVLFAYCPIERL